MKLSLFTKTDKPTVQDVADFLKGHFERVIIYQGKVTDPFPVDAFNDNPDILVSYLSAWVIPDEVLQKTRLYNINFHPGPPEYPGTGCTNFAIYNNEKEYGVTAHFMEKRVDTGKIIAIKRFALFDSDSVYSLSLKSYDAMLALFYEIIGDVLKNKKFPESGLTWKRKAYTRKELEELCRIDPGMSQQEVSRRIKATTYPGMPGAYTDIFGNTFEYNSNRRRF